MENYDNDDDRPKPRVEFTEGCFEGWTGTDDELVELMNEIIRLSIDSGMGHVVVQSDAQVLARDISIDDYAQELSADYDPNE
jgi:hypothetical protein